MADIIDAFPGVMSEDGDGPVIPTDDVLTPTDKLMRLAGKSGDFSEAMKIEDLTKLGMEVVEDYERDKADRKDWEEVARDALKLAAQEIKGVEKGYPWPKASNIRFPLLTTAILQFNARSYPAIVKGDEAVSVKVIGKDAGKPQLGPDGQPLMGVRDEDGRVVPVTPQQVAMVAGQNPGAPPPELEPVWQTPPGAKQKRANRVAEYMNTVLFYRLPDWEADTDTLLMQLPAVGCVFRKLWYDAETREQKSVMVSALRIYVPKGARSCETTPRLTEEIPDVYPYQIRERVRSGFYRDVAIDYEEETRAGGRLLLEQHRLIDLDGDGIEEPYVVTVDHKTQWVLRIEANFGPEDVVQAEDGTVLKIGKCQFYVKYPFFPHPDGNFYDLGLGHLLKQIGDVVDTTLNQMIDAGTAAAAGGGFIASGVRLQARGAGSTVKYEPGVYKTVDVPGAALREAIVERTLPQVSPVTFQVLDLILGAARDITGVKDVITGEASNTGQVGTTLALIEQGLQVYNACYKRIFRAGKEEFTLLFRNIAKYGGEEAKKDYENILDDPEASFEADFNSADFDIRPVTDPNSVTRMQRMAKGQFLMSTIEAAVAAGGDAQEILRRVYEAASIEDIDKIFPPRPPPQPNPVEMARAQKDMSTAALNEAKTGQVGAETEAAKLDTLGKAVELGMNMGQAAA